MALKDVSLSVRGGEILGIIGVSGNGQRELAEVIGGTLEVSGGSIEVAGQTVTGTGVRTMQRLGIAHVPEDRLGAGLIEHAAAHRQHDPDAGRRSALQPPWDLEPRRREALRRRPDREVRDPRSRT